MHETQATMSDPRPMPVRRTHPWIYLGLALAMSVTAYWGFAYTYFMPVFAGTYPAEVPGVVHVHGWSFFLWFLLLPIQAALVATGRRRTHMALGAASIALAAVMVLTGILVASVRIDQGLSSSDPDELTTFWKVFGQLIMYNMVLFVAFYGTAIMRRAEPELHKRMMVLASASVLPAAIFRILVGLGGFYWLETPGWVMPACMFLPSAFIVPAMVYDKIARGVVHGAYKFGLAALLLLYGFGLVVAGTPVGDAVSRVMALFAQVFGGLY